MAPAFRSWIASRERGSPKAGIPASRHTRFVMASGHALMSRRMHTRRERARFEREWCWRSSLGFTGRAAAACGWKTIFGSQTRAIKNFARTRMIFGWRAPPAKRDEDMTTPAREVSQTSGLDPKLAERILAAVREEEIVAMACDVINNPKPTGEELQMAEYMRSTLQQLGLEVTWQEVEDGPANLLRRWTRSRQAPNLLFNGNIA